MSITDALSRISQIEEQVSSLQSGMMTAGGTVTTAEANNASVSASGSASGSTGSSSATTFSDALQQAQMSDPTDAGTSSDAADAATNADTPLTTGVTSTMGATLTPAVSSATDPTLGGDAVSTGGVDAETSGSAFPTLAGSTLADAAVSDGAAGTTPIATATAMPAGASTPATGGAALYPTTGVPATTDALTSAGVALPANAGTMLTADQQQFASTLSAETGLSPAVVSSWLLAEESGGAAQSRQATGNNDWLNIGYTGSGDMGTSDAVWSNPVSAATATAEWLKGEDSVPGYGTASSGIQAILGTVGQTPQAQIEALQTSGWSGSGYPSLPEIYASVTGG